jgi:hypothetical protein
MRIVVAALLVGALVSIAMGEDMQHQTWALTTIDTIPSSDDLTHATLVVPDDLVRIASNADGMQEPGVRLRAIRGLAVYCTAPGNTCPSTVHDTLKTLIQTYATAHSGSDLLLLRAAIESDGPLKVGTDVGLLTGLLDHPSRDIRAASARALGQLCNTAATDALRTRYQNESTDQVKLAISETLRILSQPNSCLVN